MSVNAVEQPTLTLREGLERIYATLDAMSREDKADAYLYLTDPGRHMGIARRARSQPYPARPRLVVVK